MVVEKIALTNFRNYSSVVLEFDDGVHLFSGDNAQGKTNLLEAIFLSAMGKSFRAGQDDELIGWNGDDAKVEIHFSNQLAVHELTFRFMRGQARKNVLNGNSVKKKDLIGMMNAVLFSPEDLWLVKGNPSARRRFLDFELSQSDPLYYQDLLRYNRTLAQRNQLLKKISEGRDKREVLDAWDEQLVVLAIKLVEKRMHRMNKLSCEASEIHKQITGGAEELSARYFIYGENGGKEESYAEWYKEKLVFFRNKDIIRGFTDIGPHKDDIEFFIDSHAAKAFASQGQQRTIVLALKLAEIQIMREMTGERPILLLDDVMSELDEKRREKLIEAISGKIQTFITGTNEMGELGSLKHRCYTISSGQVYRC